MTFSEFAGVAGFHPERVSHELVGNRTVNLTGGEGKNIAVGLANEYLNRDFKSMLRILKLSRQKRFSGNFSTSRTVGNQHIWSRRSYLR